MTDTAKTLTLPIRVASNGQLAAAELDSDRAIASRVLAVVSYPKGWRIDDPTFGAKPSPFLQGGAELAAVIADVIDQEPAADPAAVSELLDTTQTIRIDPTGGRA